MLPQFTRVRCRFKTINPEIHNVLVDGGYRIRVEARPKAIMPTTPDGLDLEAWTMARLRAELQWDNLPITGLKAILVERLSGFLNQASP